MQGRWIYVGAGVIIALLLFFLYNKYRVAPHLDFPAMALTDSAGKRVSIEKYKGRPVVLSFAASWCGPCMRELTQLRQVEAEVGQVAAIVIVSDETPERVEAMRSRFGSGFEYLRLDGSFSSVGIHSIPTSYFLNSEGVIVKKEVGYIDWSDQANRMHLLKLIQQKGT